jgi:hypothetical protein
MPDIYSDPDLQPDNDYPDQVRFDVVHDRVRGRVLSIEKINTRFGPTAKYMLFTENGEVSMLAGSKNLWGQMLTQKPQVGDVLDVELIELRQTAQGTAKIFDVQVEHAGREQLAPPPRSARTETVGASSPALSSVPDDERDLFDR